MSLLPQVMIVSEVKVRQRRKKLRLLSTNTNLATMSLFIPGSKAKEETVKRTELKPIQKSFCFTCNSFAGL